MATNAVDILRRIREGSLDPGKTPVDTRRTCVAYLRLEGYTQEEIAEIFDVHRQTIIRDEKAIRKDAAKLVDELDVKSMAGELIASARHFIARAIREKNYALAWKIHRELIADLQSLGYLPRSPEEHRVQIGTFVDLAELAAKHVGADVLESEGDERRLPSAKHSDDK